MHKALALLVLGACHFRHGADDNSAIDTPQVNGTDAAMDAPPSIDPFGLTMVYPTKPGGATWIMPMDPLHDPREVHGGNDPQFSSNSDGSWRVRMSEVRWDIAQPTGFHESTLVLNQTQLATRGYMQDAADWKNIEATGYYKLDQCGTGTTNGECHIEHVMGGARQTSDTATLGGFPKACEADSYHANLYPLTGRTKYERDLKHTDGYSLDDPQKTNATTAFSNDHTWVGWKMVKYVRPDGVSVKLESYIDRDGDNHWVKIFEFVDHGQWGPTQGHIGSACGGGEYTVVTWGGPIIGLRWDNVSEMDVKWASIREIDPTVLPSI